jgi:hypothetical protein
VSGTRFDASQEKLDIYVSRFSSEPYQTCGNSKSTPCSVISASLKLAQLSQPQPEATLLLGPGIYMVSESIQFNYTNKITFKVYNASQPTVFQGSKDASPIIFDVLAFAGFDFEVKQFLSGAFVFTTRVDLATFERCKFDGNRVEGRSGAAVTFFGRQMHFYDSIIESNVASATAKEEKLVGGAILVTLMSLNHTSVYNISFTNCSLSCTPPSERNILFLISPTALTDSSCPGR